MLKQKIRNFYKYLLCGTTEDSDVGKLVLARAELSSIEQIIDDNYFHTCKYLQSLIAYNELINEYYKEKIKITEIIKYLEKINIYGCCDRHSYLLFFPDFYIKSQPKRNCDTENKKYIINNLGICNEYLYDNNKMLQDTRFQETKKIFQSFSSAFINIKHKDRIYTIPCNCKSLLKFIKFINYPETILMDRVNYDSKKDDPSLINMILTNL